MDQDRNGWLRVWALSLLMAWGPVHAAGEWRTSTQPEQALDSVAFKGVDQAITENMADVQSAVVVLGGRVVYEFYRDGSADTLREQQSIAKSALSTLTGIALGQGHIKSLDQPVVALVPEWAPLNTDPRAQSITVRHLLTMTAGFEVNDPTGTAPPRNPRDTWAQPLVAAPGEKFAYDNSIIPMLSAVIEKATGMPFAEYGRQQLVAPLAFKEPTYRRGLQMRTIDIAKLGHLALQKGVWGGKQIVPESFVLAATQPQNAGGLPVSLPYGYMWWVRPSDAPRKSFLASGYAGQFIWVHPPLDLVIAINSTVSPDSQRRGQAIQLIGGKLMPAVRQRVANAP